MGMTGSNIAAGFAGLLKLLEKGLQDKRDTEEKDRHRAEDRRHRMQDQQDADRKRGIERWEDKQEREQVRRTTGAEKRGAEQRKKEEVSRKELEAWSKTELEDSQIRQQLREAYPEASKGFGELEQFGGTALGSLGKLMEAKRKEKLKETPQPTYADLQAKIHRAELQQRYDAGASERADKAMLSAAGMTHYNPGGEDRAPDSIDQDTYNRVHSDIMADPSLKPQLVEEIPGSGHWKWLAVPTAGVNVSAEQTQQLQGPSMGGAQPGFGAGQDLGADANALGGGPQRPPMPKFGEDVRAGRDKLWDMITGVLGKDVGF